MNPVELVETETAAVPAPQASGASQVPGTVPWPASDGSREEWRVRCHDFINRDRCITVLVKADRVLLVGPPGETAVLSAQQVRELRTALDEAAAQAER